MNPWGRDSPSSWAEIISKDHENLKELKGKYDNFGMGLSLSHMIHNGYFNLAVRINNKIK